MICFYDLILGIKWVYFILENFVINQIGYYNFFFLLKGKESEKRTSKGNLPAVL